MVTTHNNIATLRITRAHLIVLSVLYVMCVTAFSYALFARWHYDDPYITYRYAANLAQGAGFVFNRGEHVLSTTTPLFALILSVSRMLGVQDMAALANLISSISLGLGGLCIWQLGRHYAMPAVSWAGLLLYPTALIVQITIGSETPMYLALCLAAFVFFERRQYTLCAVMCAFAVLTRGDGVLVAGLISLAFIWQHRADLLRQIPWRAVWVFLGILLVWAVPAWLYFGSPLPATLGAKRAQGLMSISEGFTRGLFTTIGVWFGGLPQHRIEVALALIGVPFLLFRGRHAALPVMWMAVYFAAYCVLGVTAYFWYYAPLVPGFIVLVGLGVTAIAQAIGWLTSKFKLPAGDAPKMLANATIVVLIGLLSVLQLQYSTVTASRPDSRFAIYQAAGEWLNKNTAADSKAGMLEVGIVGYYAQRPVIDYAGLIQPEVAGLMHRDTTYDDTAIYATRTYKPDYVLLQAGTLNRFYEALVKTNCSVATTLRGEKYNHPANVEIYACEWRQ